MKILIISGLGIIAIALGILPFSGSPWFDVGIMSFAGMGVGLILPCLNTLITSSASIDERGMITSLYGGVRFFGVAAGPPLFGALDGFGRYVMFWSGGAAALIVGILCFLALPASASGVKPNNTTETHHAPWGRGFLDTITFKNSIGRLVTRKPIPDKATTDDTANEEDDAIKEDKAAKEDTDAPDNKTES